MRLPGKAAVAMRLPSAGLHRHRAAHFHAFPSDHAQAQRGETGLTQGALLAKPASNKFGATIYVDPMPAPTRLSAMKRTLP